MARPDATPAHTRIRRYYDVSDETGQPVSVIVPIELWREIESERETAYLLRSAKMKERLLRAMSSEEGIPFEEALEKLGIRP